MMINKRLSQFMATLPGNWFLALGWLAGIQLALLLSYWPSSEFLLLLTLFAFVARLRHQWMLAGFFLGFVWLLVFLAWQLDRAPSRLDTQGTTRLTGQVLEVRDASQGLAALTLRVKTCQRETGDPCNLKEGAGIRLSWYSNAELPKVGEQWQLEARIRKIRSLKNFEAQHFTAHQLARGQVARGYVGRGAEVQQLQTASGLTAWRLNTLERLQAADLNPDGQPFFLALALGERQALTRDHWQTLERTGTIHLWVISGLHLGMLAGLVLWLARRSNAPWVPALLLSLVVAWSYAHLAGWGVAAQRAAIMLGLGALLLSGWRQLSPWTAFSLALTLVLLLNPLLIVTRGFWLSFGAVAILLFAMRGLPKASGWKNLLRVQWVITLGLTPLLLWQDAHFSIWAPLVNLVAVPLVGLLLLPLSFISLTFAGFFQVTFPAVFTSHLFAWAFAGLDWVAGLPALEVQHAAWLWLGLLGLLPPGFPGRLLAPLGLVLAFLPSPAPSPATKNMSWQIQVLDVGQGTAVLVESQGQRLLYDTGRGFPSGWAPLIPALKPQMQNNPATLQQIVISHDDIDHSGGLRPFLSHWDAEEIWMPRPLDPNKNTQAQGRLCYAGKNWQLGALDVLALWPPRPVDRRVEDEDSCVLLIRGLEHSLLLTGDAGTGEEGFFSQALPLLLNHQPLTLLQTGHHGSQTSTGQPLLDATQPLWALHTAGWNNAYNHPHESVVRRLFDNQVRQLNTGYQGAIRIQLEPGQPPHIQTWWQNNRPLWYWLSHKPN